MDSGLMLIRQRTRGAIIHMYREKADQEERAPGPAIVASASDLINKGKR